MQKDGIYFVLYDITITIIVMNTIVININFILYCVLFWTCFPISYFDALFQHGVHCGKRQSLNMLCNKCNN